MTRATRSVFVHGTLLALLLATAFFLRSWHIDTIPGGLYPDEATNATDALHANETGHYPLFYPNNYGREGLFINLQAFSIRVFGPHIWALKLWSAIFGTLAVFGVYLLAWELWRKRWVALSVAFLATFSYWAINFSRIGFRAIMVPFLLSFTFYFFFRGLRTKHFLSFFLSGIFLGLGLHTYIAFRVAPLIVVIFVIGLALSYQNFLKLYWKHALAFILGAGLAAAPMFYDFVQHPDHFSSRTGAISIFSPEINHGDLAGTFVKTLGLSLIKYNFWGDQNWRHNYPPYPVLDPFTGILFLAGFLFLIPRTVRLLIRRLRDHDRNRELAISFLLLGWLFTMLIPEFLSGEGLPHALRAIGTQPVIFLIAGLPLLWMGEFFARVGHGTRLALLGIAIIFLGSVAAWNSVKYFVLFANNPEQHGAFNHNFTNMAEYINTLPSDAHVFVYANAGGTMIDNGLPVSAQPIVFLTAGSGRHIEYFLPDSDPNISAPADIILMNYDGNFIQRTLTAYPTAEIEKIDLHPGTQSDFTVIHVRYIPSK